LSVQLWSPVLSVFNIPAQNISASTYTITDPTATIPAGIPAGSPSPTGQFVYASSNTNVATIAGNTITLVGTGTSTITATQLADGNYASVSASCVLRVLQAAPSNFSYKTPYTFTINTTISSTSPTTVNATTAGSTTGASTNLAVTWFTRAYSSSVDAWGTVYVADSTTTNNYYINQIYFQNTGITTAKQVAVGKLVAADNAGNIYTIDPTNYILKKI
jgi:hypothetical protein